MCLIVDSISCAATSAVACELLLKASVPPMTVKIVGIGQITEALALRGSKSVGGPHGLSEDRNLELGWLPENPGSHERIFEIGCEEGLCTFGMIPDLDRVIPKRSSQDVGNGTQDGEFLFAEEIDGTLYLLAWHKR